MSLDLSDSSRAYACLEASDDLCQQSSRLTQTVGRKNHNLHPSRAAILPGLPRGLMPQLCGHEHWLPPGLAV